MLRVVRVPVFVGLDLPATRSPWCHDPAGDIAVIARDLVDAWKL
jgi:hypothetical protein